MKRLILCLLVTIAGLHTVVAEPVILPVKTDTAPFFFYYDELPSDSYNLTVHYVANGTKATRYMSELMGYDISEIVHKK